MTVDGFQGDPTCLMWANRDLKALNAAIARTRGRSVAVQAGGNLGVFASALAEQFAAVYTFEPSPDLFPLLVANAPARNIVRFQAALGDERKLIAMALPAAESHSGENHVGGAGIIPTLRLDDLALPICDLLYLDIEGFELFALRGAVETIKRCRPVIALEINKCCARYGYDNTALFELMSSLGYAAAERVFADHIFVPEEFVTVNLVCVRVGDKYGPEYVPILFDMLIRNLSTHEGRFRFWCVTDDPGTVPNGVEPIAADPAFPGYWQKVRLFAPDMPWGRNERVAYFDLDVAITGDLKELVDSPGIIQDELWGCYNSSVMVWNHGEHAEVWDCYTPELIDAPPRLIEPQCLPKGVPNGGDQEHITEVSEWPTFPASWCLSYKLHATEWPPSGAKVVVFNGSPKPHECDGWVGATWKLGGFTSLPEMKGCNVEPDVIWRNIEANVQRDIPWFRGAWPSSEKAVLVCGGPSLADHYQDIRWHKRHGAKVFSVNNTLSVLIERGIKPDAHIVLDARPENIAFVPHADTRYFLAAQCDPSLFEHLKDQEVTLWHTANGDDARSEAIARPFVNAQADRLLTLVPGGGTVGLRAMWLAMFSGYRKLHIYGMDGSYEGDKHHAYDQTLNDGEDTIELVMGAKRYRCARWMARQAREFEESYIQLVSHGMEIWVHGRGLIPDMAAALREQRRAA